MVLIPLMLVSFSFNRITVILSILGATSQIYLTFFIPIMIYIKSFNLTFYHKLLYLAILVSTCIIGIAYLALAFLSNFVDLI